METGRRVAVIHQQFLREVSGLAIRAGEITESRTALRDGAFEDVTDRGNQCIITDGRYPARSPGRVDTGHEQRLGSVNVADTNDDFSIHYEVFHRPAPAA